MAQFKNVMEIFRLLDKSNCQRCGSKTCLAFAAAVFSGQKALSDCPTLPAENIPEELRNAKPSPGQPARDGNDFMENLKAQIEKTDLAEAAKRIQAGFSGGRLTLKVLGKDFGVDEKGNIHTDLHVNPWIAVPFFDFVLNGRGLPPTGNWVSFRELKDGLDHYPLFKKRCEEVLKQIADVYTDFFDDMVHMFGAKPVAPQFESDISVVLHPLPLIPVMICYARPEDGIPSTLNVFFDETADKNLSNGSIFTLGAGLAQMFSKFAARHGFVV